MNKKTEMKFEEIINKAMREVEDVKCDKKDFVEGLELVEFAFKERRALEGDSYPR